MAALRPYQSAAVQAAIQYMRRSVSPCMIEAATGCHAIGHPILMHDGTIKSVEDIVIGDNVMGPDSNPRVVIRLHRGRDDMIRVTPKKGEEFVVNSGHVFSLYISPRRAGEGPKYREITAKGVLEETPCFRHRAKLQRVSVDMPHACLPIPPWVLGAIIGDGCVTQGTPAICTADIEVADEIRMWSATHGCEVRVRGGDKTAPTYAIVDPRSNRSMPNRITSLLGDVGVWGKSAGEKYIPQQYLSSSRDQRLELIAGLLDTDGCVSRGGHDWISKSPRLAADMLYLCRSVGLAAYMTECEKECQGGFRGKYYRVSISGDMSCVPFNLERRIPKPRSMNKDCTVTGFTLTPIGEGDYFGFEVDGDHLYLDGHFVRHHNSGKSHIIAEVARQIHAMTGKRVLCLAPSAELVTQNFVKYADTGNKASMFSASTGRKETRHPVVFGSPLTVKNNLKRFCDDFALVVIDECHGVTPTILEIIRGMQEGNPNLRVFGTTATPYRLGSGYIFARQPDGTTNPDETSRDPYFTDCVYAIKAPDLIAQGFLTPPVIGSIGAQGYDTRSLIPNSRGQFDAEAVDKAYHGQGRKTAAIVADVVSKSRDRNGVMFFAATVQHAQEIMASLPPSMSAMVTGETSKKERDKILRDFKARRIKYLVNVSVLTTGFDAPHVDVIAILRKTESVGLLQQIIGRGLRLSEGKRDCLILDYTDNLDTHCPDGDLFAPVIRAKIKAEGGGGLRACCPQCNHENTFSADVKYLEYEKDENGYIVDLDGNRVASDYGPIAGHHGRRCFGLVQSGPRGEWVRCGYRWTHKECPACNEPNDIAARYCCSCRAEIIDPNEKLAIEFKALKKDPTKPQTDSVIDMTWREGVSRNGNRTVRVSIVTPYRKFEVFLMPESRVWKHQSSWEAFQLATQNGLPKTVSYVKGVNGFFEILGYNGPVDELKEVA